MIMELVCLVKEINIVNSVYGEKAWKPGKLEGSQYNIGNAAEGRRDCLVVLYWNSMDILVTSLRHLILYVAF